MESTSDLVERLFKIHGDAVRRTNSLCLGLTYNVGDAEAELADGGARRQLLFLPQQQEARRRDV